MSSKVKFYALTSRNSTVKNVDSKKPFNFNNVKTQGANPQQTDANKEKQPQVLPQQASTKLDMQKLQASQATNSVRKPTYTPQYSLQTKKCLDVVRCEIDIDKVIKEKIIPFIERGKENNVESFNYCSIILRALISTALELNAYSISDYVHSQIVNRTIEPRSISDARILSYWGLNRNHVYSYLDKKSGMSNNYLLKLYIPTVNIENDTSVDEINEKTLRDLAFYYIKRVKEIKQEKPKDRIRLIANLVDEHNKQILNDENKPILRNIYFDTILGNTWNIPNILRNIRIY